jgi:zinc protease
MKRTLLVAAIFSAADLRPSSETLPAGVQKMTSMGGITEYDYPNGLKVLLFPDAAEPKITVNVTYLVDRATRAMAKRAWRTCSST